MGSGSLDHDRKTRLSPEIPSDFWETKIKKKKGKEFEIKKNIKSSLRNTREEALY